MNKLPGLVASLLLTKNKLELQILLLKFNENRDEAAIANKLKLSLAYVISVVNQFRWELSQKMNQGGLK